MRKRPYSDGNAWCPSCDGDREPWYTTCPHCEFPFEIGPSATLSNQLAAPLGTPPSGSTEEWIDLPVGGDQPVKTALLRSFLTDQGFDFEESRRFVSIRRRDAAAIEAAISVWAYQQDLPEDHRHLDSLMSTLIEIGNITIEAIRAVTMATTIPQNRHPAAQIEDDPTDLDLR